MALLILALLQRIFLMSSLMLLLVWLIFFMVLIKRSEERFSRNAETDLVCRLLLEKKKNGEHRLFRVDAEVALHPLRRSLIFEAHRPLFDRDVGCRAQQR